MICKECDNILTGRQKQFCSNSCKNRANGKKTGGWNNQRVKKLCYCGNSFQVPPCRDKTALYCSRVCGNREKARNNNVEGKHNPMWKGKLVGKTAMHCWTLRNWTKTGICEHCRETKPTDWANKTGKYIRGDKNDWLELCRSCHTTYDGKVKYLRQAGY